MGLSIFGLILGGVITIGAVIMDFKNDAPQPITGSSILASAGTTLLVLSLILLTTISEPQAIDVYRNKTTLKVTYVDSVAVDSVVVFK